MANSQMPPEEQKALYENLDVIWSALPENTRKDFEKIVKDYTYYGKTNMIHIRAVTKVMPKKYKPLLANIFSNISSNHDDIHVVNTSQRWLNQRKQNVH